MSRRLTVSSHSELIASSIVDSSSTLARHSKRDAAGDRWHARKRGCISSGHTTTQTCLIDTRLRGKPDSVGGADWKDRSILFRSHGCACSPSLGRLMERAEKSTAPYLCVAMSSTDHACSVQLYCGLVMMCKRTALTRVVNAGSRRAWKLGDSSCCNTSRHCRHAVQTCCKNS